MPRPLTEDEAYDDWRDTHEEEWEEQKRATDEALRRTLPQLPKAA
ncbi:MAG: hypothetical protein ACXWBT_14400 [Usitatibacter sp.]